MKKEIETVHPTHTCFDDALELFMVFAKNQRIRPMLVHAICQKEDGSKFSYAWVERDGVVYFAGLVNGKKYGFECELPAYYGKFGVLEHTKYSFEDLLDMVKQNPSLKAGPWKKEYQELTRDHKSN